MYFNEPHCKIYFHCFLFYLNVLRANIMFMHAERDVTILMIWPSLDLSTDIGNCQTAACDCNEQQGGYS